MAILKYNEKALSYQLIRRRGMKTIRVKISADGEIVVSTNPIVSEKRIEEFLLSRIDWITENADKFKEKHNKAEAFTFTYGDNLNIFGQSYILFIISGDNEHVGTKNNALYVTVSDLTNQARIGTLVFGFASEVGRKVIDETYDRLCRSVGLNSESRPKLVLKLLKSKWGHNNRRKNEIMLNLAMCGLPYELIEYVIAHEIVHCFVPNHSAAFYSFGAAYFGPDFKALDRALNRFDTDIRLTLKNPQPR